MESEAFFDRMPCFSGFAGITEARHFAPVPSDWFVVITDVEGSTRAIESGRYKEVNTVGAAAIACAETAMAGVEFPYVFGGDGASMVVPPSRIDAVKEELTKLKALSENRFGLSLRVGVVSVAELYAEAAVLEVAKFELSAGKCIGIFRGGGLTAAEKKIKGDTDRYGLPGDARAAPGLAKLSCRWQPLPSRHGQMLAMLVVARSQDEPATYRAVLEEVESAVGGDLEQANPVSRPGMHYRSAWSCLRDEVRYTHSWLSRAFFGKFVEILLSVLVFKVKFPLARPRVQSYASSIPGHSDYRKFDDALRLVIDCSAEQIEVIRAALERRRLAGELFYGLHISRDALMTCHVDNLDPGEHIHFIDGGDGGYAMAATELKAQMAGA